MSDYINIQKRAKASRREAELKASGELFAWHKGEAAKIADDPELGDIARAVAKRDLLMEFGRRSKKALSKAKRDNSPARALERQIRAEIAAEKKQCGTP